MRVKGALRKPIAGHMRVKGALRNPIAGHISELPLLACDLQWVSLELPLLACDLQWGSSELLNTKYINEKCPPKSNSDKKIFGHNKIINLSIR
jgi:hypothetical protein